MREEPLPGLDSVIKFILIALIETAQSALSIHG